MNGPFLFLQKGIQKGIFLYFSFLKSSIYKALRACYILLPQQTNSTFIILSFSPVKCISSLHFKRCIRGANHCFALLQNKYLCGLMIISLLFSLIIVLSFLNIESPDLMQIILTQGLDSFPLKLFNCFSIHRMHHPEIFQTVSSLTELYFRSLL